MIVANLSTLGDVDMPPKEKTEKTSLSNVEK